MRIAILVKQVPAVGELSLGDDGTLQRAAAPAELNPHCRRAVAKGVQLARESGGSSTVITMGPPPARAALVEALDYGADHGVLLSDSRFAGADTLATARTLAAALDRLGPFDLVLTGVTSVDSGTGQVAPQLAALLDLPYLEGVRELGIEADEVFARCETDDGWRRVHARLPLVLACAERLCDPAKRPDAVETDEIAGRITVLGAAELGPGPWGQAGSPTRVGAVRHMVTTRAAERVELDAPAAAERLHGALKDLALDGSGPAAGPADHAQVVHPDVRIAVLAQPGRPSLTAELLGGARRVTDGPVTLVRTGSPDDPARTARALHAWLQDENTGLVLAPATTWGREVTGRLGALTSAGLVSDTVAIRVEAGELVYEKPVPDGQTVADVHVSTALHIATVRPGVFAAVPGAGPAVTETELVADAGEPAVVRTDHFVDDTIDELARARVLIGVGAGVDPDDYPLVERFAELIGAQIGATRKVTDKGWLPHSRQIGVTGRSVAPEIYLALGVSGKSYHAIGFRRAHRVIAVNSDPAAPIFELADLGIVAPWREVITAVTETLAEPATVATG